MDTENLIVRPKKYLNLNKDYYITCDPYTWMLVKKNNEGLDEAISFSSKFSDMLHIVAERFCRVPKDIQGLSDKIDRIHSLIDKRVPENYKVKDLVDHIEIDTNLGVGVYESGNVSLF